MYIYNESNNVTFLQSYYISMTRDPNTLIISFQFMGNFANPFCVLVNERDILKSIVIKCTIVPRTSAFFSKASLFKTRWFYSIWLFKIPGILVTPLEITCGNREAG